MKINISVEVREQHMRTKRLNRAKSFSKPGGLCVIELCKKYQMKNCSAKFWFIFPKIVRRGICIKVNVDFS